MKRCIFLLLLLSISSLALTACGSTRPDSLDETPTAIQNVHPVYDRFFRQSNDRINITELMILMADQNDLPSPKIRLDQLLKAWRIEASTQAAAPEMLESLSNLNRFLFDGKGLVLKENPYDVSAGLLSLVYEKKAVTPLSAACLYLSLARSLHVDAELVEWPGGFGVRCRQEKSVVYVWPARQGRAYTQQGLQQYFMDDARYNLSDEDIKNKRYLAALSSKQIASRLFAHTGYGQWQSGNADTAKDHLQIALLLDPDNRSGLHLSGDYYRHQGNLHLALDHYEAALQTGTGFAYSHYKLGQVWLDLDYDKSLRHFNEALRLKPNYADAYAGKGRALLKLQRHKEAIDCFKAGLSTSENHPELLRHLSKTLWKQGQWEDAIPLYRKAIAAHPHESELYIGLAACLQQSKQVSEALATYDRGTKNLPADNKLRYYRATLLLSINRPGEAADDFKTILAAGGDPGNLNERIGDAVLLAKDPSAALTYYMKALDLQPNRMNMHYKIARVYGLQKDHEEAINWLRGAQALGFRDYDTTESDAAFQTLLQEKSLRDIFGDR